MAKKNNPAGQMPKTGGEIDAGQKKAAKAIAGRIRAIVLSRKGSISLTKAPRVSIKEGDIQIDIHTQTVFGSPIPELTMLLQKEAKIMCAQEFSGYHLRAVNIWVDSVRFDQQSIAYREQSVASLIE